MPDEASSNDVAEKAFRLGFESESEINELEPLRSHTVEGHRWKKERLARLREGLARDATGATPPQKKHKKPGPRTGKVRRYIDDDRALFPEIERLQRVEKLSLTAATTKLAGEGKVKGTGTSTTESRAKRLAKFYGEQNPDAV